MEQINSDLQSALIQSLWFLLSYLQSFFSFIMTSYILIFLSTISGVLGGFSLGLIGGGGSILAVPLLIYLIGLDPHMAIGTSAFTVGVNALINFFDHRNKGHVHLKTALRFAIPGVLGTLIGSQLGLLTPSNSLLVFFAIFMIIVAIKTLIAQRKTENEVTTTYTKSLS